MWASDEAGPEQVTVAQPLAANWVCCHLGAREHYAVPRALHRLDRLRLLVTDAWVKPGSVWSRLPGDLPRRLSERFHPDLADAEIRAFTLRLMAREALWRSRPPAGWDGLIERNRWFGQRAVAALRRLPESPGTPTVAFAHSYSARDIFTYARARGWTTVLGQIDPGPEHFRLVQEASEDRQEYGGAAEPPPAEYFDGWRDECRLADWIVVNSEWSRESLSRAGIPAEKLRVVPLAYEPDAGGSVPARQYPSAFTRPRPLRVLFVGHVAVAKGVPALLEAMALLPDVPIELRLVGATSMAIPARFLDDPAIQFAGAVSRSDVMRFYRESDVLVFPSLSDGFGMAQIEAQGWRLPIIASRSCGSVVRDGINGLLLDEVSATAIAAAITRVAQEPQLLEQFSRSSTATSRAGVSALGPALLELEPS
jgi:glycosyltransferase involved in cell wall biosynthesis